MGNYLIPANSKKSKLILGFFNPIDLVIFTIGCILTLILLFTIRTGNLFVTILDLLPALISAFLVMPVPNYHNMMTLLHNIYSFYFVRNRKYYWRGWCVNGKKR